MNKDFIINELNTEFKNITLYKLKPYLIQSQRLCNAMTYYIINKTIQNSAATTFTFNTIIQEYEELIFKSCLIFLSDKKISLFEDIEYYYNSFLKKELDEKNIIHIINIF